MSKTSKYIIIPSGFFFEWVQPRSATCTDMKNRRNSQLLFSTNFDHACYKMTKQGKCLQIANQHGLLTTIGLKWFYIKMRRKSQQAGSSHTKFSTCCVISTVPLICRLLISSPQDAKPLTILVLFKCFFLLFKLKLS